VNRIAGPASLGGLVVGYAGGALMHFPPFPIQDLVRHVVGSAAVMLLGLGTTVSLLVWAWQPDSRERRSVVVPILSLGGVAAILNVLLPARGYWGGPIFDAPLPPLAVLTGLRATVMLGLCLLLYRWLLTRRVWLARAVYLLILAALVPGTILGDQAVLRSGLLTFGNGYTIAVDVVLSEIYFGLPPILFELMRGTRTRATRSAA
jgi:hypothetical protein